MQKKVEKPFLHLTYYISKDFTVAEAERKTGRGVDQGKAAFPVLWGR